MDSATTLTPRRRLALTIVIMVAMLMQILDSTIANVALPHMQASLNASPDTISWVITSYIIAAAVATPVTGWLEARVGRHVLMPVGIIGFTLASMMCGMSTSLPMMVCARLLQGLFGAFIAPLTQAVMLDIYTLEQRTRAMAVWAMGMMVAPIMGPILGGWLTENYDWRWVFFINVPIGILATVGVIALMPRARLRPIPFDAIGFTLLALALGALQLLLDRGTQLDWFNSTEIIIEFGIAIAMFWMFAVHTFRARNPLIPRELLVDRNFVVSSLFLMSAGGIMMTGAVLLPPMLQSLYGYSTIDAGLLIMPRGFAMLVSMFVVSLVADKIDNRFLVATGMVLMAISHWLMTGFSLDMGGRPFVTTGFLQGFGYGLVMLPLQLIAFATIPAHVRTSGAAIYSLARNLGASVTISLFAALTARNLQVSHSDLSAHLDVIRYPIVESGLLERMGIAGDTLLRFVDSEVNRQAMMISYLDDFWLMGVITITLVPLTVLLRATKPVPAEERHMAME